MSLRFIGGVLAFKSINLLDFSLWLFVIVIWVFGQKLLIICSLVVSYMFRGVDACFRGKKICFGVEHVVKCVA